MINGRPVWVGIAMRAADGSLYVIEIDRKITAHLEVTVEEVETFESAPWRSFQPGDTHIRFSVDGIGRNVEHFDTDMGANRATKALEVGRALPVSGSSEEIAG